MISVIMGVYNGEKTVARAVTSVLEGEYADIQFIVVDDGSTDGTYDILRALEDSDRRVLVIRNEKNEGLAYCLNKAIELSEGEFIARQDADDVSYPNRLNEQLNFLKLHPEVSFVGCGAKLVDYKGKVWGTRFYPMKVDKKIIIKYNPFIHPSLVFRREALIDAGGYRNIANTVRCEDYDLVFRLYAKGLKGANIPKIYMDYHEETDSAKRHSRASRLNEYRVRREGVRAVRGGITGFIYTFKPIVLMMIDRRTYNRLHNNKWQQKQNAAAKK